VVSDSYDIVNAVENIYGGSMRDYILSHDKKIVVRPDSGDPVEMSRKIINMLWDKFGGHENERGYKVLNPKIGMIYGDGINYNTIDRILQVVVTQEKFAPSNIIFGMGGALLQQVHRDTQKFAFKASAIMTNGQWHDVYKEPITDPGKKSKRGRLVLVRDANSVKTVKAETVGLLDDILKPVFYNGDICNRHTFEEVRSRASL
jgi:nicotinamide phosphoribosyltransferase